MSLAKKLQVKPDVAVRVVGAPVGFTLDAPTTTADDAALLVFAKDLSSLKPNEAALLRSAKADRLTWIAYPKAGQLGTDLSRDVLLERFLAKGAQVVRNVAIDDVWSALRLRAA